MLLSQTKILTTVNFYVDRGFLFGLTLGYRRAPGAPDIMSIEGHGLPSTKFSQL
jgi:hypothetical protein